jgi:hypothetical protein
MDNKTPDRADERKTPGHKKTWGDAVAPILRGGRGLKRIDSAKDAFSTASSSHPSGWERIETGMNYG